MKLRLVLVVCVWLIIVISAKSQIPFYRTEVAKELWKNRMSLNDIKDSTDIANFKGSLIYDVKNKDDILCKLKNTKYIMTSNKGIDSKALECVKDSLKYLILQSSRNFYKFSINSDIQLNDLELLDAMTINTKFLAYLINISPKMTYIMGDFKGNLKPLNDIANDSLRYVHINLRAKKWIFGENKVFPSALINAPKMEELHIDEDIPRRMFKMPKITSDSLPLRRLIIPIDICDPYNLEQITKLRNLEYLDVYHSIYDEGYMAEDEEKIEAKLKEILQALEYIDELYFDGIKVKSSERNK